MKNDHALAFDRKAEAIYRQKLRPKLEGKYKGRIVAIDVGSGDYFLGKTVLEAIEKGRRKHPGKIFYAVSSCSLVTPHMAIQGKVNAAREPVVVLQTTPKKRNPAVIIDTGFSGELCLSPKIIDRMGFERIGREAYVLADRQIVHADIYKAQIVWFNHRRVVEVIALDNPQGLLGTQLLQQCTLTVHFRKRKVSINRDRR